jgi:hypothetical protein
MGWGSTRRLRETCWCARLGLGGRSWAAGGEQKLRRGVGGGCHTLKYLILGCECLLGCVHLSIGFSKNFKDFFCNYSIYPRARSIFLFYLESSKILFYESQIFYLESSCPKLPPEIPRKFLGFFRI